ncbi:interleukin-13 receptor subunit alpha-1-like [Rhinoraja longicauda]
MVNYCWSWPPPRYLDNDSSSPYQYDSYFQYDDDRWQREKINSYQCREEFVDCNRKVTFHLRAYVKGTSEPCRASNWVDISIPSEEGVAAVKNFNCVFYNFEYINCTWDMGSNAPPDAIYHFHYWQVNMSGEQNCSNYIYNANQRVGCQIHHDHIVKEMVLHSRVEGESSMVKMKPFYYKLERFAFVKLRPPGRIKVTAIPNGINVSWTIPSNWNSHCVKYEVNVSNSKKGLWMVYSFQTQAGKINGVDTTSKNKIQVRAMYETCGSAGIWSEWSSPEYFGEDTSWNWSVGLMVFIPLLVAVTAIMLFTKLKQLRRWILPPIPDPGRLLKDMFLDANGDHSLRMKQHKGSLTLKPELELTCKVTTVEPVTVPAESTRLVGSDAATLENQGVPVDDDYMQYRLVTC